jgi:hypothetical protein
VKCPECGRRLRVTNVISTGSGKTQAAECGRCRKRFTFMTVLVGEIKERGDGPHAIAQRLKAGEDPLEILA